MTWLFYRFLTSAYVCAQVFEFPKILYTSRFLTLHTALHNVPANSSDLVYKMIRPEFQGARKYDGSV